MTSKLAYVASGRGVEDIYIFVENIADLAQILKHTGDRPHAISLDIPLEKLSAVGCRQAWRGRHRGVGNRLPIGQRTLDFCRKLALGITY